jgi:rhodanese-related sulfurtransferase
MFRSVVLAAMLVACGGGAGAPPAEKPPAGAAAGVREDIAIDKFAAAQKAGVQLVDVRSPEEYAAGHVPGAVLVPLGELKASDPRLASINPKEPVYFICAVGGRSSKAADQMAAAGWHTVNVQGGTNAWIAAGNAVDKAAP